MKHIQKTYYTCDLCGQVIEYKAWKDFPNNGMYRYELRCYSSTTDKEEVKCDICLGCYTLMADYCKRKLKEQK